MGKPLPSLATTAGAPPAGDQANTVISGAFTAVGQVSQPFCMWGGFNVLLWASSVITLTTQAGVANATAADLTGITAGVNVSSSLLPSGANLASLSTIGGGGLTTVQIGGLTATQLAAIAAGTDAAAVMVGPTVAVNATVVIERSFDGGVTWLECNIGGAGTPAQYQLGSAAINNPVSVVVSEPEQGVAYRLHCTAYTSGTVNYRVSTTGAASLPWGIRS